MDPSIMGDFEEQCREILMLKRKTVEHEHLEMQAKFAKVCNKRCDFGHTSTSRRSQEQVVWHFNREVSYWIGKVPGGVTLCSACFQVGYRIIQGGQPTICIYVGEGDVQCPPSSRHNSRAISQHGTYCGFGATGGHHPPRCERRPWRRHGPGWHRPPRGIRRHLQSSTPRRVPQRKRVQIFDLRQRSRVCASTYAVDLEANASE